MTHYSGVAFMSHWQRFTTKPAMTATLKAARPQSWRTSLPLKFIGFRSGEARRRWTHRWRAVSEQQQEQQRVQHHRQRPHSDRGVPPPPPPSRRQLIFTCVCAGGLASHLRHNALGEKKTGGKKLVGKVEGGNTRPLVRVTHATWAWDVYTITISTSEGVGSLRVCRTTGEVTSASCRSWLPVLWCPVNRKYPHDKSNSCVESPENERRAITGALHALAQHVQFKSPQHNIMTVSR